MSNWGHHLARIADKPQRRIVGLMSGTSVDGLDIVLCRISGTGPTTRVSVEQSTTRPYSEAWKDKIRSVFANNDATMLELCLLNEELGLLHGHWVKLALEAWQVDAKSVDLVASHGQTVYHAPTHFHQQNQRPNGTLQIGDGDHLAAACGIVTVADFRQRHLAAGGEGAPLVLYGDQLLFSDPDETRVLLNLGGISNLTLLPSNASRPALATDVGPANTLLDAYCQRFFGVAYDEDGNRARSGKVNQQLLNALMAHPFFQLPLPKTTGPELFNLDYLRTAQVEAACEDIAREDVMRTLVQFTAQAFAQAVQSIAKECPVGQVFVSGGGTDNSLLMTVLQQAVPDLPVRRFDALGISASDKEAVLFAVLANECIAGDLSSYRQLGNAPNVRMGKVCFPC